jgi:hypothetical protein
VRKRCGETEEHRISRRAHDRNRPRGVVRGERSDSAVGDDDVDVAAGEIGSENTSALRVAFGAAPVDDEVLALDPAIVGHLVGKQGVRHGSTAQDANATRPLRLLLAGRHRQRARQEPDERTPIHHRITSSTTREAPLPPNARAIELTADWSG